MFELGHIALVVRDIEKSTRFYRNVLDFSIYKQKRTARSNLVILKHDSIVLELLQYIKPEPDDRQAGVIDHMAFLVQDLRSIVEKLQRQGVEFESSSLLQDFEGSKTIFLRGPDGERIELVTILGS